MKMKTFGILATLLFSVQSLWALTTVTTVSELHKAVKSNQTVTLFGDITLNSGRRDIGSSRFSGSSSWDSGNSEAKLTQTGYKYIDHTWDHSSKTLITEEKTRTYGNYSMLSSHNGWTELTNGGWFVVDGNISIAALVVGGTSNLILCDGSSLTLTEGLKVEMKSGAVLNIYGQAGNTGRLIVTNSHKGAAGIGSGGSSSDGDAGMINIHGGNITATGNQYGAGIGGGDGHGFGQQANNSGLYVYGGYVTAQGGEYGAGIGSGDEPDSYAHAGYVAVYGGTVNATGGKEAAGIGGGNEGNGAMFSIYGGNVTALGGRLGAGIGGGDEGHSNTTSFYGGTVNATGGYRGAGIGGGEDGYATGIEVYGGNITAKGGESSAGIGGGYEGDCRGIQFYDGTVHATGYNGAAGIGGGYESDYCELNIYGGNITAIGDGKGPGIGRGLSTSSQSSSKKVLVNISGGEVTATSTNGGAGIGTGEGTKFNGRINISGGTVNAIGNQGGAGIGTGVTTQNKACMYGWIIISGGTVIAKGNGDGAGIGGGSAGEIYEEGLIQILGGNITASSNSGGAIGSGGKRNIDSGDGTYDIFCRTDCPIIIEGDNITMKLTSGPIDNKPCQAIRFDADRGGSLAINGKLAVSVNGTTCSTADRVNKLQSTTEVLVTPCTHDSNTYTVDDGNTHTAHCNYCTYEVKENHSTDVTICKCGYDTGVTIYTLTFNTANTDHYDWNTSEKVVAGKTYVLPDYMDVPMDWEFVGWAVANSSSGGDSLEPQEGEELLQPGKSFTVTQDATYYARYRKINLSLSDTESGNMATLRKYNQIRANTVTLTGRKFWKDGSWNTICLPFQLNNLADTPLEGATVRALESTSIDNESNTMTLNFSTTDITAIEAGKPYIVKWEAQTPDFVENPVFSQVIIDTNPPAEITSDDGYISFVGTYSPVSISSEGDPAKLFIGENNTLYWPEGEMTIGACRGYFQLNGITADTSDDTAGVKAFKINFGDDEATGIATVETDDIHSSPVTTSNVWYAIDGRRITGRPLCKGIYIHNGRKIAIK